MVAEALRFDSVVLIDDSDVDLFITEKVLEMANITSVIKPFNNPIEALKYLKTVDVTAKGKHLIFLDINMPYLNGFEFLKEFENSGGAKCGNFTIVMLSSSNDPTDISKAGASGFVRKYLQKPLSPEALEML